jgi:hypothetical protein
MKSNKVVLLPLLLLPAAAVVLAAILVDKHFKSSKNR